LADLENIYGLVSRLEDVRSALLMSVSRFPPKHWLLSIAVFLLQLKPQTGIVLSLIYAG
jgi:hypothetical protein